MKIIISRARNEVSRPRVQWLVFSICSVLSCYNDSENPKMSKHGTAGTRKPITLTILPKLGVIRRFECGETEGWFWLHTALDCQLCMMYRNRTANYD
jgi:hypothetical protein